MRRRRRAEIVGIDQLPERAAEIVRFAVGMLAEHRGQLEWLANQPFTGPEAAVWLFAHVAVIDAGMVELKVEPGNPH